MSNNYYFYYNAVYTGNINTVNEEDEGVEENIIPYSSAPQTPNSVTFTTFMPVCYFLEATEHYKICETMLSSTNYKNYNVEYYTSFNELINNIKTISTAIQGLTSWENPNDIILASSIDEYLELIIGESVINTILEINLLLRNNFTSEEDITKINIITSKLENWYTNLDNIGKILNFEKINNIQAYVTCLGILIMPIKFVAKVIETSSLIINDDFLFKKIGIGNCSRNIMLLSLINKDIAKSIILKINKTEYTKKLLEKFNFNNIQITYIDILALIGDLTNILDIIDLSIILDYRTFDNNNFLHILLWSISHRNFSENKLNFINNLNNDIFGKYIYELAFIKNDYDMIPLEFTKYDYNISHFIKSIYLTNPLNTVKNLNFDTIGLTHSLMDNLIDLLSDQDILENIDNICEIFEKELKYTIKYTRTRHIRKKEEQQRTYITIQRIINICVNNKLPLNNYINLLAYTSDNIVTEYLTYITDIYEIANNNCENNDEDEKIYDNELFNKAYLIWKNIEFLHYYNNDPFSSTDINDIYLGNIIKYTKILLKVLERRIIEYPEYFFIDNFIKKLISIYGYSEQIIKILFLLNKEIIPNEEIDDIFHNLDLNKIYKDVVNLLQKEISINKELFNYCLPKLIQYIKSHEDFKLFVEETLNKEILYCSELPLDIKFGKTALDIYYHFTHHYKVTYILPETNNIIEYKHKYGLALTDVIMGYEHSQCFIIEEVINTFEIDEEFINKYKLRKRFIDSHKFFNKYSSYNFIYWYDIFVKLIKFEASMLNSQVCEIIFSNEIAYNISRIWIKYGYLTNNYIPNYIYYFDNLVGQILLSNDFKQFIKTKVIQLSDFLNSTNITKLFLRNTEFDFIFSDKNLIEIFIKGIYEHRNLLIVMIEKNKINYETLMNITINIGFPAELLLHRIERIERIENKTIIEKIFDYIKKTYIYSSQNYNQNENDNENLLYKLFNITLYNNLDLLNLVLTFIFQNFEMSYILIKDLFKECELNYFSIYSYINALNNIKFQLSLKNLLNFLIDEFIKNDYEIPITTIINNNPGFLEKSKDFSLTDKINILLKINSQIDKKIIVKLLENIEDRNDCDVYKIYNLITYYFNKVDSNYFNKNIFLIFPELINTININSEDENNKEYNKELVNELIEKSIYDETYYNYLINFKFISNHIKQLLLNKYIKSDYNLYISTIIFFDEDIESLINNDINFRTALMNYTLLNKILTKKDINKNIICELKNNLNRYCISECSPEIIMKYIDYYTYDNFLTFDKTGKYNLFSFYKSSEIIDYILEKFKDTDILNVEDNFKQTSYYYYIKFNNINNIDKLNKINLKIFIKLCRSDIDDTTLMGIIDSKQYILDLVDENYNCIGYYLMKYRQELFKNLMFQNYIVNNINYLNKININNETLLMVMIRNSKDPNIEELIEWLINKKLINSTNSYGETNSGSLLSYALKYNHDLFNPLINILQLLESCIDITDYITNLIDINCENYKSDKIKLNLVEIATVLSSETLQILIRKLNRRKLREIFNEKFKINKKNYNLLLLAMYNNPESVEVLTNQDICDDNYIQDTLKLIDKIEDILEFQPGSFYYLQKSTKFKKYITLNLEEHFYGFNYKNKLTPENINSVEHYIVGKQEFDNNYIICELCMLYKPKVIFTECRHKFCIVCALKSKNCQFCRAEVSDENKILF